MTMMIKRSNKSLQNSINDTQLVLGEDVTLSLIVLIHKPEQN